MCPWLAAFLEVVSSGYSHRRNCVTIDEGSYEQKPVPVIFEVCDGKFLSSLGSDTVPLDPLDRVRDWPSLALIQVPLHCCCQLF